MASEKVKALRQAYQAILAERLKAPEADKPAITERLNAAYRQWRDAHVQERKAKSIEDLFIPVPVMTPASEADLF